MTKFAGFDADYYIDYTGDIISISDLPIGARFVDLSWEWEFRIGRNDTSESGDDTKPVIWIVATHDHYEGLEPNVTLLTEELIGWFVFDKVPTGAASTAEIAGVKAAKAMPTKACVPG